MESYNNNICTTWLHCMAVMIVLGLMSGCQSGRDYFPRQMEKQHIEIVRFDTAIMNVKAETARQDIERMYADYEDFMPIWVENIIGIPATDTDYLCKALPAFLNDTMYGFRETNMRAKQIFADVSDIQCEMDAAFTRIHYLYPDWTIPKLYLFVSGFNASVMFIYDDLAAGVDMYLGSDYEYYNRVVYDYQKQTMRKECLATDVVSAYLFRNIAYTSTKNRLLDNMIYRGKVMYLLSCLLPEEKDWEIMGYTKEQWQWAERNERQIWNTVMDKRDLFKTESMVLTSYLNDGPFTSEVSQDAPGRLGTWIGWRIVESYMTHNQEVSMQQLMEEGDAEKILENSYYKP